MKRILALDGGGIRGVFSLEILSRMEALLREHFQAPQAVLADYFDFFAGTSTGAIIATCLSWGMPVQQVLDLYVEQGRTMFQHVPWYKPLRRFFLAKFEAKPLAAKLQQLFSEDGHGQDPAFFLSPRLKKLLLVVVRNHTTGSHWPLTNNPKAKFMDPLRADSNAKIPLWKLVRASTAAPVYFPPETIQLGDTTYVFVDGGMTPYNNPALIAALTAVLPCYRIQWEAGPDKIRVISLGTLGFASKLPEKMRQLNLGYNASRMPLWLIQGIAWEQDFLCRCLGQCLFGERLDAEIGDLIGVPLPGPRWFSYVRYNKSFRGEEAEEWLRKHPGLGQLDAVHAIPLLREIGQAYARENVKLEHLI